MSNKFAKIDISGISYTRNDCEKILPGKNYILEIQKNARFVDYSQYERPIWILKDNIVRGYGVTYKKKVYRVLNSKELGLE